MVEQRHTGWLTIETALFSVWCLLDADELFLNVSLLTDFMCMLSGIIEGWVRHSNVSPNTALFMTLPTQCLCLKHNDHSVCTCHVLNSAKIDF